MDASAWLFTRQQTACLCLWAGVINQLEAALTTLGENTIFVQTANMNPQIAEEIQAEQEHGRSKYGTGPDDFVHDDAMDDSVWHQCIWDHNERARWSTPMERRQHLIKLAGLAVSAVEAFDRKRTGKAKP
jgi:hypothetical protein